MVIVTLGENRVFDRLLFQEQSELQFVVRNVRGVLDGMPAFRSFQQRLVGPILVSALDRLARDPIRALEHFFHIAVFATNFLLFHLLRRKGTPPAQALLAVGLFGLVRILLTYRLEYPWDEVDLLLFTAFGYAASQNRSLQSVWLLLLIGTVNHETVLYIPLWFAIAALVPFQGLATGRQIRALFPPIAVGASIVGIIFWIRKAIYVGSGLVPGETADGTVSMAGNQFALAHNIEQFFLHNWTHGRAFISLGLALAIVALVRNRDNARHSVASWWSLSVIGTIFCFGYINETRLYLGLLAFWFAYAWPVTVRAALTL